MILDYSQSEIIYYLEQLEDLYFHHFLKSQSFETSLSKSISMIEKRVLEISQSKVSPDKIQLMIISQATSQFLTWFTHDFLNKNQLENIQLLWRIFLKNPVGIIPEFISHVR